MRVACGYLLASLDESSSYSRASLLCSNCRKNQSEEMSRQVLVLRQVPTGKHDADDAGLAALVRALHGRWLAVLFLGPLRMVL